jgi:hypothetical protein
VLALLLGDVWRVPHLITVHHRVCREHGELVHEHEGGLARDSQPVELARSAIPALPGGHHHDHCALVATTARSAAVLTVPFVPALEDGTSSSTLLSFGDGTVPHPARVLAYAPKQSPPV